MPTSPMRTTSTARRCNQAGYSVPKVQSFYQTSYNAWVNNAGVSPDRLILSEYYSNSLANNGYGANGTNGEAWQAAMTTLAAHDVMALAEAALADTLATLGLTTPKAVAMPPFSVT